MINHILKERGESQRNINRHVLCHVKSDSTRSLQLTNQKAITSTITDNRKQTEVVARKGHNKNMERKI